MKKLFLLVTFIALCISIKAQQLVIPNNQYHLYGPNSTWGEYLQIGGNGRVTSGASIAATNGNLHLDAKDGTFATFINHYSQNNTLINTGGGNVGVGTSSPLQKLDINGGIGFSNQNSQDKKLYSPVDGTLEWMTHNAAGEHGFAVSHQGSRAVFLNTAGNSYINGGNLGIGTANPLSKLEVKNGNLLIRNFNNVDNASAIMVAHSIQEGEYSTFGTSLRSIVQSSGYNIYGMQFFTQESYLTGQTEKMRILGDGNVGIGTTTPDEKLTVKGKIHAEEVKVDLNVPGPDYVFAEDYHLPSLASIQNYIKDNKHLPEVPSAKEMEKNGINLSEMNMLLLKKVEELTLHLIQQSNDLKAQKDNSAKVEEQIGSLLQQNEELIKRLQKLEKR